jgi:large subunit ribosomal protein L25
MADELHVELRNLHGKRNSRRLRRTGLVPAILYGHGLECVSLAVQVGKLETVLRHGSRLVNLVGAANESAFVRELQWDTFGTHVLHVDLTRISAHEKVEVQVTIELRGEAPGVREGGMVSQLIHQVSIECPAGSIPDKLLVNINHLALEQAIKVSELKLPEGAVMLGDPEAVVVQCMIPVEVSDEAAEAVPGEPEVIGAKKEEEGEDE